jgi:putative oxidoreductase
VKVRVGGEMSAQNLVAKWPACAPYLLSVLRIVAAFMFVLAGTMKLFAFPTGIPPHGGTVPLMSEVGLGGVLETFGGGLLMLGLFTRPVAFLLAGEMAVAYFQYALPEGFWPVMNNGVTPALYCFVWLYISAAGAGPWSLDALRGRTAHLAGRRQPVTSHAAGAVDSESEVAPARVRAPYSTRR